MDDNLDEDNEDLQEAHNISQENDDIVQQSRFEILIDMSPLDDDNLVLALFHSYVWSLTTYFVVIYWKMIAWLFGLVRYLENNLSAGLAFTCSYLLIPLLYSLYLQYTTEDMNGRRRLVSLIVSTLNSILQPIVLQGYRLEFSKPSLAIPPLIFASFVPLLTKWFGYNRYIILGGNSAILFSFYWTCGMMYQTKETAFIVWSATVCCVSAITFQRRVASLRPFESLCALNDVGLNLNGIADILLTRLYGLEKHI